MSISKGDFNNIYKKLYKAYNFEKIEEAITGLYDLTIVLVF